MFGREAAFCVAHGFPVDGDGRIRRSSSHRDGRRARPRPVTSAVRGMQTGVEASIRRRVRVRNDATRGKEEHFPPMSAQPKTSQAERRQRCKTGCNNHAAGMIGNHRNTLSRQHFPSPCPRPRENARNPDPLRQRSGRRGSCAWPGRVEPPPARQRPQTPEAKAWLQPAAANPRGTSKALPHRRSSSPPAVRHGLDLRISCR